MSDDDVIPRPDGEVDAPLGDASPVAPTERELDAPVGDSDPASAAPGALLRVADDIVRLAAPVAEAAHRLVGVSDLVRLVPPEHLREGLDSGALQYMQAKAGQKAIVVQRDGGQIAGHANIERAGQTAAQAALAFQVMAAVTQQYYLHEISGQLEAINARAQSIEDRQQTQALGELLGIEREVHDLRTRRLRGLVEPGETVMLRQWSAAVLGQFEGLSALMERHFSKHVKGGADRRRAYIKHRLSFLADAPARDFDNVLVAGRVLLTIREELLARASSAEDLGQLLDRNEQLTAEVLGRLSDAARPFAEALTRAREHDDAPYVAEVALDQAKQVGERVVRNEKIRRVGGQALTSPARFHPTVKLANVSVRKALRADERRRDERIADFDRLTAAAQRVAAVDLATPAAEIEARRTAHGELELSLRASRSRVEAGEPGDAPI